MVFQLLESSVETIQHFSCNLEYEVLAGYGFSTFRKYVETVY